MGNAINSYPVERGHAVGRTLARDRLAPVGGRTLSGGARSPEKGRKTSLHN